MNKKITALVVVSVLLTSCGGVTPVPSKATLTPPVIPTFIIEGAPSVSPTEVIPSPLIADDYKLKPWEANDSYYAELTEEFGEGIYDINSNQQRYSRVFKAEKILRDPSQDWREIAWEIVADYPNGVPLPGMHSDEDLLSYLIEDALNNQRTKPENLLDLLEGCAQ